jgi:hypothetical protein
MQYLCGDELEDRRVVVAQRRHSTRRCLPRVRLTFAKKQRLSCGACECSGGGGGSVVRQ